MNLTVMDGLWQAHQRGHLPVQDVDFPPNLAASLNKSFSKVLYRHVSVHTLSEGNPHSLCNLHY
jgi:hypothetical protein